MTFHNPSSMEDLAFPPQAQDLLGRLQAPGRVFQGGAQTRPVQPQPLDFAEDWGGAQRTTSESEKINIVRFFVPGKPQGKGRPRAVARGKFVRMYTPEKTVNYESIVALAASQAMAGRAPIEGPVSVVVFMLHPIPTSWSKRKKADALECRVLPTVKCDADNCLKALFDAMNQVVWVDDVQVVGISLTKRYSVVPGVRVAVSPVEEF